VFNTSELLFAIVHRMVGWDLRQPLDAAKKHLIATLRDEIRQPDRQPLRLTIPREERLARVADALLDDVGDDRTLDDWAHLAGMARRTFMRAFSAQAGMSFGRWRQQARLFAALEMLAQSKSVTEVAIAVGYDSVSAFIEMFRTMLGTTDILSRQAFVATRQGHGRNGAHSLTLSRYRQARSNVSCTASSASGKEPSMR
jgi:transcriptional regulator GlxA family with amidase domain